MNNFLIEIAYLGFVLLVSRAKNQRIYIYIYIYIYISLRTYIKVGNVNNT